MSSSSSSSSSGISFLGLLQVLFIALKLTGHLSWPWWQVLLPTFVSVGLVACVALLFGVLILSTSFKK